MAVVPHQSVRAAEHGQGPTSPGPVVRLINAFQTPFNNAVATARTCYSPRVVLPDELDRDAAARQRRDALAESIYRAGHHTTLQPPTFQFTIERVSRQCLWSFLHSHPFYNSEQVSQRYVTVNPTAVTEPPLPGRARDLFWDTVNFQMDAYRRLTEVLCPVVRREYKKLFPLRDPNGAPWARWVERKAQEVARYVLPVATQAHLYHTVSGLTLHRYHRLCRSFDAPWEQRLLVDRMVEAVRAQDPLFADRMEDPLPMEDTPEHRAFLELHGKNAGPRRDFLREFDERLEGRSSRLIDWGARGEETLAQAVRSVMGVPRAVWPDEEAIARVLDPTRNPYFSESLNLTHHSKLCRALHHMHFTFAKKLSHTADSQDQRHRTTPGSRPVLAAHLTADEPDYITPALIGQTPAALDLYRTAMVRVWQGVARLLNEGVPVEFAQYLLPNAVSVRFEESGDVLSFHHKWTKRLCYTSQEEIWRASVEEVLQVRQAAPRVGRHLGPPCLLRAAARARPFCPEGDRFCGVVVWKKSLEEYERMI